MADGDGSPGGNACKVADDGNAPPPCLDVAPPESFEPAIQWEWPGEGTEDQVVATPIVGNLTDDNGDGVVDLCDIPDVVAVAYAGFESKNSGHINPYGHIYVLDGETGELHFRVEETVGSTVYPALGDLDGDGVPEIVTVSYKQDLDDEDIEMGYHRGQLTAIRHDGTIAWKSEPLLEGAGSSVVSLADLDADGDVEIVVAGGVFDHEGKHLWQAPDGHWEGYFNIPVDLDGDDDLEIVWRSQVHHHDGSLYWSIEHPAGGVASIANLDDDPYPEVVFVNYSGLSIVQHDGTVSQHSLLDSVSGNQPTAIHDMDGDGSPDMALADGKSYTVLGWDDAAAQFEIMWTTLIDDGSGYAGSTAFDFLGDGGAEAIYADETTLFVFDGDGQAVLTTERSSWTQFEYPVVADVDNDGSAEIVVVSNFGYDPDAPKQPPVRVIRDVRDRWIPARRIWNQFNYHVTNVREDGTIPAVQPKNWLTLNTFRTQAQIQPGGGTCKPEG